MAQPTETQDGKSHIDAIEMIPDSGAARGIKGIDKAAELLQGVEGHIVVTPAENRRVLRKIDLTILPILLVVYCLQYLDKATLSYASVFGLIEDTHLVGSQYSWLGSIVYLAQLVMQPLVAFFLVKLPIGKFTGLTVMIWGAVLCCMTAADRFAGLLAARFFLGVFEAAVAPAFVAIVQMWWKRSEQTNRNAAWYATLGLVNIFGSLLTYGLGHINSSLHSYQIIFLFCGSITVVVAVFVLIFMPDSPMEAKFLSHQEKLIAVERLRMNQMGISSRVWKWDHVLDAALDLKTWIWFSLSFAISIPSGGISTFGPLIVKSFGFDSFTTILFNMPFGAVQIVATLGGALVATKLKKKSPVILVLCLPAIAGIVVLMALEHTAETRAALLVGYYLISVYPGISPLVYSWSSQNTAGDTKRKVTTGIIFVGQSVGNIVGPQLFKTDEAPRYLRGLRANLGLFVAVMALTAVGMVYIGFLNRRHARMREAMGKSARLVDLSMEPTGSAKTEDSAIEEEIQGVGSKAFDDVTDLRNEDFIFLY